MTPEQCRAARGLLDWSQSDLADKSNLSQSTVRDFEKGRRIPAPNNIAAMRKAFEDVGVQFISDGWFSGGAGVRFSTATEEGTRNFEAGRIARRIADTLSEMDIFAVKIQFFGDPKSFPEQLEESRLLELESAMRAHQRREETLEELKGEFIEITGNPPDYDAIRDRYKEYTDERRGRIARRRV